MDPLEISALGINLTSSLSVLRVLLARTSRSRGFQDEVDEPWPLFCFGVNR